MWLDGHSASGVDHGSVSRPGSTLLAVMLKASGTGAPWARGQGGKGSDHTATARGERLPPAPSQRNRPTRGDGFVGEALPRRYVELVDVSRQRSQRVLVARHRVWAAVDARHDVGALAVDVGVPVEVAAGAELLDE